MPRMIAPPAVGVDISDASIRWLGFEKKSSGTEVRTWGEIPLESGIVAQGIVKDGARLVAALMEAKKQWGGVYCVNASLPEESGYVFSMQVPDMSDREQVMNMIGFELEARVPIPASAALYDFDQTHSRDASGVEIGVVVFARESVDPYVDAFSAAGIQLLSLELEARSIARVVSDEEKHAVELLVDFGRNRTGCAVLKGGVPIFTSTVMVGGETMTTAAMKALSLSHEDADLFIDTQGLIPDEKDVAAGVDAIMPTATALAEEVVKLYRYWDTRRNERGDRVTPVERIILVGGSANLRGLNDFLAARVQSSVVKPDVWGAIVDYDTYIPPIDRRTSLQFATVIGLALRSIAL